MKLKGSNITNQVMWVEFIQFSRTKRMRHYQAAAPYSTLYELEGKIISKKEHIELGEDKYPGEPLPYVYEVENYSHNQKIINALVGLK